MNFSYQHANSKTGHNSYLLRFRDDISGQTACILVDAGDGVNLDALLGEDEYLTAVLLTHAHHDHYASLPDVVRDGAPVYTSQPTANILETVLTENAKQHDFGDIDPVLDALSPLSGWESVTGDIDISPIPAGHAPGAAGFVLRLEDGSGSFHVLMTGDFTTRRSAGYPGLSTDLPVEIDVLFLNVASNESYPSVLTTSLERVVERSRAGSSVLVTAGGLTGVQYAYLLDHLSNEFELSLPVRVVGQAAKLCADLTYDFSTVDLVPVFDDPDEQLAAGTVTIAGPEVPVEGSARRLFEAVKADSGATLVQLISGALDPVESAGCTVYSYEFSNHPSVETIDTVVDRFRPVHVVVEHGGRRTIEKYRDKYDDSFVWANNETDEHVLYTEGDWRAPPWLSEEVVRAIRTQEWQQSGGRLTAFLDGDHVPLPPVERSTEPSLEAEGVIVPAFDELLAQSPTGSNTEAEMRAEAEASTETEANAPTEATSDERSTSIADDGAFREVVLARLDEIEAAVSEPTVRARVIDAGDGVTLLRLLGDVPLEHGRDVEIRIRSTTVD